MDVNASFKKRVGHPAAAALSRGDTVCRGGGP